MRGPLRYLLTSLLVGMLSVGLAWAGSGLMPVADKTDIKLPKVEANKADLNLEGEEGEVPEMPALDPSVVPPEGFVLAGASAKSVVPQDPSWVTDRAACATLSESFFDNVPDNLSHAANAGTPWPENPNCLYMGGYGIGPMNPITSVDETGLWVRSAAVRGSNGKTFVTTIIDAEGYFWDYNNKCDDCGIKQLTAALGTDPELAPYGLTPEGIVIASTHSHTSPDLIGGWGFVPDWYMTQVGDAIKDTIRQAVKSMQPAYLETGEETARPFNGERRDTYYSAEEQQLTWLRAVGKDANDAPKTIFTLGGYAAHPVTREEGGGIGHADWPVHFEQTLEQRFGGVGLLFMTGLGNMSPRHPGKPPESDEGGEFMGRDLANLVPDVAQGMRLHDTRVAVGRTTWAQPATNVPLTALGTPGFFDRKFLPQPAQVVTGKNPGTSPCASASPASVEVAVSAFRVGGKFAITSAPGEIFSNFSNTVKDRSGAAVTIPIGQANDALGYMPQEFEINPVGQQGLGLVPGASGIMVVEYEDGYAIDQCFGEMALATTLSLLGNVQF